MLVNRSLRGWQQMRGGRNANLNHPSNRTFMSRERLKNWSSFMICNGWLLQEPRRLLRRCDFPSPPKKSMWEEQSCDREVMYLCRSDLGGSKLIINEESSQNSFFLKKSSCLASKDGWNSGHVRSLDWPRYHHTNPSPQALVYGGMSVWFSKALDASGRMRLHITGRPKSDPNRLFSKVSLCLKQLNWLCPQEWSPPHSSS